MKSIKSARFYRLRASTSICARRGTPSGSIPTRYTGNVTKSAEKKSVLSTIASRFCVFIYDGFQHEFIVPCVSWRIDRASVAPEQPGFARFVMRCGRDRGQEQDFTFQPAGGRLLIPRINGRAGARLGEYKRIPRLSRPLTRAPRSRGSPKY